MKKKLTILALIFSLLLGCGSIVTRRVPGADFKIVNVKLKWLDEGIFGINLLTEIWVWNRTYRTRKFYGVLTFYDEDGRKIGSRGLPGKLRADESKIFRFKGLVSKRIYENMKSFKVTIVRTSLPGHL
jgi:hypothetical protein